MSKEKLQAKDYQQALEIQNACNPSGLLYAWIAVMQKIRNTPEYQGTEWECRHPINVLFAYKMASLCGQDHPSEVVDAAWKACEQLASKL